MLLCLDTGTKQTLCPFSLQEHYNTLLDHLHVCCQKFSTLHCPLVDVLLNNNDNFKDAWKNVIV